MQMGVSRLEGGWVGKQVHGWVGKRAGRWEGSLVGKQAIKFELKGKIITLF